jgi:hypothetical protein
MTRRGYVCGLQAACVSVDEEPYLSVGGSIVAPDGGFNSQPLTAVYEVGAGQTGEFYCAGIYPARISITSTDAQFQYAWLDNADTGELKTSVLGEFYVWEDRWTIEVEGEDDEEWCYVERVPMLSSRQSIPGAFTNAVQWSGPAKLLAGSVGGTYTWQQAFTSDGADFSYSAGTFSLDSTLTSTALNLAEADTNGHVCSVPDASIPAGWAPLPILGYVNMNVSFYQGVYRAWFFAQNQFSGACS